MLETVEEFDAAMMEYVWFPDRSKWSIYERTAAIEMAGGNAIPIVRIPLEELDAKQLERVADLLVEYQKKKDTDAA